MKYEDFEPLGQTVSVTMSLKELAVLWSGLLEGFEQMTERSPFWNETEKLLNELSDITKKATAEKERYDKYAEENR